MQRAKNRARPFSTRAGFSPYVKPCFNYPRRQIKVQAGRTVGMWQVFPGKCCSSCLPCHLKIKERNKWRILCPHHLPPASLLVHKKRKIFYENSHTTRRVLFYLSKGSGMTAKKAYAHTPFFHKPGCYAPLVSRPSRFSGVPDSCCSPVLISSSWRGGRTEQMVSVSS